MVINDYTVSKFEEAEPLDAGSSGVTGSCLCVGRVACRCLPSSPPSFSGSCFQPFSPLPRPGGRSGLALGGPGPSLCAALVRVRVRRVAGCLPFCLVSGSSVRLVLLHVLQQVGVGDCGG